MLDMELSDLHIVVDPCNKYPGQEEEIIDRASTLLGWLTVGDEQRVSLKDRITEPYGPNHTGWYSKNTLQPADDGGWDYPGDPRLYPHVVVAKPGEILVFLPADIMMYLGPDSPDGDWQQSRFD